MDVCRDRAAFQPDVPNELSVRRGAKQCNRSFNGVAAAAGAAKEALPTTLDRKWHSISDHGNQAQLHTTSQPRIGAVSLCNIACVATYLGVAISVFRLPDTS
jgi:hypothetical protein